MLDIMRKKKRMKEIVLWAVIIATGLSMVVWGVALNLGGGSGPTAGDYAAIVDDRPISVQEFKTTFERSIRDLKQQFPDDLDPDIIKSLGMSQQVLNRLVRGRIVEILAERNGLSVSPNEIRQAILKFPDFQVDGKFIGLEQYKTLLAYNGYTVEGFEDDVRYDLLSVKLTRLITDSLEISDQALREEYLKLNQTTKVAYVLLNKADFRKRVQPTDGELRDYFDSHKDAYQIKEKRRAEYLLVPTSKFLPTIQVSDQEIRDEWEKNPVPETVEAAHILFLVNDPSEEEAVRTEAESVLEKLKAGGDFAALAREYSEDPGSAEQGGYLGTFPRGAGMAKEFEDAAFSLEPGQISGLVRTPDYGFHIIKVIQHNRPTLESNRNSLLTAIRLRKAKDSAKKKAEEAAELAANGKDLSAIAEELDFDSEVKETGLFNKEDNPYSLGISQALSDDIFKIEEVGTLGSVVEHTLGFAFAKLQEIQKTRPGLFGEFTDQVKADLINARSKELMEAEAEKLSEDATLLGSLAKAAGKLGYDVKTSKDFKVDETPDSEIEDTDAFNYAAFQLDQGSVSQPILMTDTAAVLEVKERSGFDETAFEEEKEALHDRLYTSLQQNYLEAYFRSFREELEEAGKIRVNPEVFDLVDSFRF